MASAPSRNLWSGIGCASLEESDTHLSFGWVIAASIAAGTLDRRTFGRSACDAELSAPVYRIAICCFRRIMRYLWAGAPKTVC